MVVYLLKGGIKKKQKETKLLSTATPHQEHVDSCLWTWAIGGWGVLRTASRGGFSRVVVVGSYQGLSRVVEGNTMGTLLEVISFAPSLCLQVLFP